MKRISFFLALTSFINCNLNSQTVFLNEIKWDFGTANSGTFAPSIPISIQSRVSATEITKSTGIIPDLSLTNNGQGNPGRALIVTGFDPNLNSVGDLEVYDQFIGFSITPSANNFMTITGISMDIRHQGNSGQLPNTASARYRIGNGPWNTIDTDRTINNAWNNISFSTSGLIVNVSTTVEFKIGFWYSFVSTKDPNGQVRVDNITFSAGSSLPIELLTFTAAPVPTGIALHWSTATEVNNAYVALERSTDGRRFEEIHRVPGEGDSFEKREYAYTDEAPVKGINYYRLRQVDYDGTETYGPVAQARFGAAPAVSVYPSPAVDKLTVALAEASDEPLRWEVYDASGRLVLQGSAEEGISEFPVDVTALDKGVYSVQVFVGREMLTERFVKSGQ
jgi:hypothetical protein